MNDNETKLVPPEALNDDALDKVTGGDGRGTGGATCPSCQQYIQDWRAEKRDDKYYCPNCHTVELPLGYKAVSQ